MCQVPQEPFEKASSEEIPSEQVSFDQESLKKNLFVTAARRSLDGFILILFLQRALTLLCSLVFQHLPFWQHDTLSYAVYDVIVRILWFLPVLWYGSRCAIQRVDMPREKSLAPLPLMFAAMLFTASMARLPGTIFFGSDEQLTVGASMQGAALCIWLFSSVILGPLLEEYMFRRVLLRCMLPFGRATYLLLSSLLFALLHTPGSLAYAFVAGLFFGYVAYISGGGIRLTFPLHVLCNALAAFVTLVNVWGTDRMRVLFIGGYFLFVFVVGLAGLLYCLYVIFEKNPHRRVPGRPFYSCLTPLVWLFLGYCVLRLVLFVVSGEG